MIIIKKNTDYVFLNTPKTSCYKDFYFNSNIKSCRNEINNFCVSRKIKFYDLFNEKSFDDKDFVDHNHLNQNGVKKLLKVSKL